MKTIRLPLNHFLLRHKLARLLITPIWFMLESVHLLKVEFGNETSNSTES